uniref:Uncharacterized protein n=1 Tax=Octopus bimaculoides TaxID=37653 RepID=A0A0L8H1X4_OCTBM
MVPLEISPRRSTFDNRSNLYVVQKRKKLNKRYIHRFLVQLFYFPVKYLISLCVCMCVRG